MFVVRRGLQRNVGDVSKGESGRMSRSQIRKGLVCQDDVLRMYLGTGLKKLLKFQ